MYYNKNNVIIDVLQIINGKVHTEKEDIVITDSVQMEVKHNNNTYYTECYYTGDNEEGSDSYVIRVYDDERGLGNSLLSGDCQIAVSDVDSSGNCYDRGLGLKDTEVEEAIMEVLFGGDKPVIVAF